MLQSIIFIYSLSNQRDRAEVAALLEKLKPKDNSSFSMITLSADFYEAGLLLAQCQRCMQTNNAGPSNTMILALNKKGLEALCTLKEAGFLDNVGAKIGLSITEYSDQIEELQFNLDFLAIPTHTLNPNEKVIRGIPNRVFISDDHLTCVIPTLRDMTLIAEGIEKMYPTTCLNMAMDGLASLAQWVEVAGLFLVAGAARRDYLSPTQAILASGALIFSCVYRNSNTANANTRTYTYNNRRMG